MSTLSHLDIFKLKFSNLDSSNKYLVFQKLIQNIIQSIYQYIRKELISALKG